MNAGRILLSTLDCPTLPPLPPVFHSVAQSVSCDEGSELISLADLPAGVTVSGTSLILAAGHSSASSQAEADAAALAYLQNVFDERIASADLVCLLPPLQTDLCGWWRADSFNLPDGTAIGGPGLEWQDEGSSNNDLTQGTAANRPVFKTNIFGSKPCIRFDGVDDFLNFTSQINFTGGSPNFTMSVVYKHAALDDLGMIMGAVGGNPHQFWSRSASNVVSAFDGAIQYVSSVMATSPLTHRVVTFRNRLFIPTEMFRENKTNFGPLTQSNIGFLYDTVGKHFFNLMFNGDIAEILLYCEYKTDEELDANYNDYLYPKYFPSLPL